MWSSKIRVGSVVKSQKLHWLMKNPCRQAKMVGAQAVYQNKNQNQNIDITNQNF